MTAASTHPFHAAIACGGTGGHLFPGLAVGRQLVARGCRVTLLVSPKEVDQQAVRQVTDMTVATLPAVGLSRGKVLAFAAGFLRSYLAAKRLFRPHPPQAALAMGGFTSAPPILAARGYGARTYLHESNVIPGRANRWLSRVVDEAFVGFAAAAGRLRTKRVTTTGTPVRPQFQPRDPAACRSALGLAPAGPVVLVMGGSQGASGINQLVLRALPLFAEHRADWQWLHLTGTADLQAVKVAYAALGFRAVVRPFLSEMELALGAASAAVSRAGASSLAELAALRLPSLLIPFPQATDDHQYHNAQTFAATGAAKVLRQEAVTPMELLRIMSDMLQHRATRESMQAALARWDAPQAAARIAERILEPLGQKNECLQPQAGGKSPCAPEPALAHPAVNQTPTS
jgi:UDP-N-acetylglucosamine--N-acetylmuramyl-(pentapeptide) pyrophosphoryl-undecaprenol N-acetylglucosamine transferase